MSDQPIEPLAKPTISHGTSRASSPPKSSGSRRRLPRCKYAEMTARTLLAHMAAAPVVAGRRVLTDVAEVPLYRPVGTY